MRRPTRNIEIFSMSVLDLFASALGAFIMVSVILYPYFNEHQELEVLTTQAAGLDSEIRNAQQNMHDAEEVSREQTAEITRGVQVQSDHRQCQRNTRDCQITLAKNFLVVQIQWLEAANVDLLVTDPDGHVFTPEHNNRTKADFPSSDGQLSVDMQTGPGIEVWQDPSVPAGDYKVSYRVASLPVPSVAVRGWFIQRSTGRQKLPDKTLTEANHDTAVATLRITEDGHVLVLTATR